MLALIALASALASDTMFYDGIDLICTRGGAHVRMWRGSPNAPSQVVEAQADHSREFSVDVVKFKIEPLFKPSLPPGVYTLAIHDLPPTVQYHVVQSVRLDCNRANAEPVRIRPTPVVMNGQ